MAITASLIRSDNSKFGKMAIVEVTMDNSYPTGGEVWDLSAAASGAFTSVYAAKCFEGPYDSNGAPTARTTCSSLEYDPAASRAVATGLIFAYAEDGTSGVQAQVANTTDLSAVISRWLVIGT